MYLEKLEIQGFKSFANKNVLLFPGMIDKTRRGLTAIVGPNGSGKSNIADCIRWVLGEQSMKTLRGKRSEDVIFSGSDKKGKLGMAEVSLFLNNEDGSAPIDYSQVILTRRLYRNGESEYLLNNSRVRLADIQIMLAKAKFGQKTYSVIGQGMVEDFLNTSLSERKEFFDEATGVKQYQIKRDDSLNKLKLSYENLSQAQMLLEEIEPRLKSLTRQVGKLQKRGEYETELRSWQRRYYSQIWHELDDKHREVNSQFLDVERNKVRKEKDLEGLEKELRQMEKDNQSSQDFDNWQVELGDYQRQKEVLMRQLAQLEAQLEVKLEGQGQFDLSWLNNKKSELEKEKIQVNDEMSELAASIASEKDKLNIVTGQKTDISTKISEIEMKISEFSAAYSEDDAAEVSLQLKELLKRIEDIDEDYNQDSLKGLLQSIRQEIKEILEKLEKDNSGNDLETIQRDLIILTKEKEEVSVKIHEVNLVIYAKDEKRQLLMKRQENINSELARIDEKLKKQTEGADAQNIIIQQNNVKDEISKSEEKIRAVKEKISGFSREEEAKRIRLFDLQRRLQQLQNEVNGLNNHLNELKITSTRHETRLEDLEIEIRESFGDFKEIRETQAEEEINIDEAKERINSLKKQIDLIGGIDPEVEKEYANTKERFDYLSSQAEDLTGAIKSLEEIIRELDMTIKEQFDKEFKIISEKFEEYFKILFNGGAAKIIKVMENELEGAEGSIAPAQEGAGEVPDKKEEKAVDQNLKKIKYLQKHSATGLAGIEIQATPPGKKIKSIAMLSGGERSLIAIAMICAIISSNPSPFVVLDEVDASLDEANSERLAKILDDLSHKTQFIVVTHNRASMRRANILYGVTMQDDGVSQLLSIKLEEATKNAK